MSTKESIYTISKNKNIHFYKKIFFDVRSNYKNILYYYDLYDVDGEITKTIKHNYENKPADLLYFNYQLKHIEYWVHGKRHRKWGPAVINFNKREVVLEEWYHNGTKLTDQEVFDIQRVLDRKRKLHYLMSKFKKK